MEETVSNMITLLGGFVIPLGMFMMLMFGTFLSIMDERKRKRKKEE